MTIPYLNEDQPEDQLIKSMRENVCKICKHYLCDCWMLSMLTEEWDRERTEK